MDDPDALEGGAIREAEQFAGGGAGAPEVPGWVRGGCWGVGWEQAGAAPARWAGAGGSLSRFLALADADQKLEPCGRAF